MTLASNDVPPPDATTEGPLAGLLSTSNSCQAPHPAHHELKYIPHMPDKPTDHGQRPPFPDNVRGTGWHTPNTTSRQRSSPWLCIQHISYLPYHLTRQIIGAQHMACTQSAPPPTLVTNRLEDSQLSPVHPPFTYARTTSRHGDPRALPHQLAVWRMCSISGTPLSHPPAIRDTTLQLPAVPGSRLPSPRLAAYNAQPTPTPEQGASQEQSG